MFITILKRVFLWAIIFLLVSFVGLYFYLENQGGELFQKKLSRILKRNVTVGHVRLVSPYELRFKNLKIDGLLEAKSGKIVIGFPNFSHKQIIISELAFWEPFAVIQKRKDAKLTLGDVVLMSTEEGDLSGEVSSVQTLQQKESPRGRPKQEWGIVINALNGINGQLIFQDRSSEKDFEILIANADLAIQSIRYPVTPEKMPFGLKGSIFSSNLPFSGNILKSHGWINFLKKDMDAQLRVIDREGKEVLSVKLVSQNNDMSVQGKLSIRNLPKGMKQNEESKHSSFEDFVFGSLQSSGVEIGAEFALKTKMDDMKFDAVSFSGNIGYNPQGVQAQPQSADPASAPE